MSRREATRAQCAARRARCRIARERRRCVSPETAKPASAGGPADAFGESAEVCGRSGACDREPRRARRSGARGARRYAIAARGSSAPRPRRTTGAESAMRARRAAPTSIGADVTRGAATTTGSAVCASTRSTEPSARTSIRAVSSRSSRRPACSAHDLDSQPSTNERSVLRRAIDTLGHTVERELERGVGNGDARKDLGAEEASVQTAKATDRPEAVSCPLRRSHGALPVGIDPELVRSERERLVAGD